jgi:hypothetical protein
MHIQDIPELVEYQRKRIERLRHTTDLPAPWEVYPDIPSGSIGWRMGPREDVYADWLEWLRASTTKQREDYCKRHPEPKTWLGTYEQHFRRFAREPHGLSWDEFWDAEFKNQYEMYGPVV